MKLRQSVALCLVAATLGSPVFAATITKGTVVHPGGNTCTPAIAATFDSDGDNLILIHQDLLAPFVSRSPTLTPSAPAPEGFIYTTSSGGTERLVTVTTYRGLTAGQQYSLTLTVCGPPEDVFSLEVFTEGCSATPFPPTGISCQWEDVTTGEPVVRFDAEPIWIGESVVLGVRLVNSGFNPIQTVGANCYSQFTAADSAVFVGPGQSAVAAIRYDATIDDTVAGELFPTCGGGLILARGIGPRLVIGTPSNVLRRHLDGSEDAFMGSGASVIDLALDTANRDVYMAKRTTGGTGDGIYKGNLDGNFMLIVSTDKPSSVDYDPVSNKVYWSTLGSIRRANTDGTVNESLPTPITYPLDTPVDIAIDPVSRLIYWTQDVPGNTQVIKRAGLDGQDQVTLHTFTSSGTVHLTLDRTAGRLYWSEAISGRAGQASGAIRRMYVDGTNEQELLTPGIVTPASVVVDAAEGKVYWSDQGTNSVHRVDLGGGNHEEIVTGIAGMTGLLLMRPPSAPGPERLYWTDNTSDIVGSVLKDGSSFQTIVNSGLTEPRGMAIDGDAGKVYWVDQGTTKRIRRANIDGSNLQDLVTTGLAQPQDIALDAAAGKMYWTDSAFEGAVQIKRANLDGTGIQNIFGSGSWGVRGIALDPAHGKMYWSEIEAGEPAIYRANMNGTGIELFLVEELTYPPLDIEVDAGGGKVYWTEALTSGTAAGLVRRGNLDGTGVETLYSGLASDGGYIRSIALDLGARKVYWSSTNTIRRRNLDGSGAVESVAVGLLSARAVAVAVRAGYPTPTDVGEPPVAAVPRVHLDVPRPNPFNPTTTIAYTHAGGRLDVSIYDVRGRLVRTLFAGPRAAGQGTIVWEGKDDRGSIAPSGLYLVKLRSNGQDRIAKAVLVR